MTHADTLRRIAGKLDAGEPADEILLILLMLAKAMVKEEKSRPRK